VSAIKPSTQIKGEVMYIGPMAWYDLPEKPDVKVGDNVYYSKYGAMVIKVEGMDSFLVICNDKDVLVAYEGDAKGDVDE
jgi:co-chaperonin GroES (HSP10)